MTTHLDFHDILLRLIFTLIAGGVIGFNRGEQGKPVGLRTTMLVCLAASLSMIQANLLMDTTGKTPDSFIVLDLMRLPLGILSGMGFIGAGAILRRENRVVGVTTAATLWFVTMMGLCFGGGQTLLGFLALGLSFIILWAFKYLEHNLPHQKTALLTISTTSDGLTEDEIRNILKSEKMTVLSTSLRFESEKKTFHYTWDIKWISKTKHEKQLPRFLTELRSHLSVISLEWKQENQQIEPS